MDGDLNPKVTAGYDMTDLTTIHTPVMLERCVELLAPALDRDGAVAIDATLGMGGHTEALLTRFPGLTVIGFDRDTQALTIARERLARFGDRVIFVHSVYDEIASVLAGLAISRVDGILFDLGVSSMQLDRADRGFAYAKDAPLDMRMNRDDEITAADVLAEFSEQDLTRIFRQYGDEKLAARYARAIVREREVAPIETSARLVAVLTDATPGALLGAGHPAKRVFQALRIEVNHELTVLERAIPAAVTALALGGRIVVMSYQSLEDKIVKKILTDGSTSTAPVGLPVELEEHRPILHLLTRGAEQASAVERDSNPRSIPVRLRAAEKVRDAA
jgi:16S rRNA (cytosine1402-N4)-methyltransferase